MDRKSFEEWMKEVDGHVSSRCGLGVYDLPDCPFQDWYDSGLSASGVALLVVHNAN